MRILSFIIFTMLFMSGCSSFQSEEKAVEKAVQGAEEMFQDETPVEVNYEAKQFSLYIPKKLGIGNEDENNVILEDGDQTYIVFYNEFEDKKSKLHYDDAKAIGTLALESFEDDEKFGYIRVMPDEGEGYELQTGIGGVKITTITTKGKIAEDAEEMMKIAKSIVYSN